MIKDYTDPFYTIEYEEEDIIYNVGEDSACMYAVVQGRVSLFKRTQDGDIQIKSIGPGAYFGAVSYLGEVPRRYKAVATQYTKVQRLFEDNLESYIMNNSQSVVVLMDDLSSRLVKADKSLGQIGGIDRCVEGDAWFEKNQEGQSGPIKPSAYVIEARNDISHHLYPKGHKHYNVPLDAEHEDMLFDKNVVCPVCEKDFTLYQLRTSKFKLVELKRDMRQVFEGVDEIWYNIWTCPHCKYSNFHYDFPRMKAVNKEKLLQEMPDKLAGFHLPETLKTSYNEVFDSYYLAMACKDIVGGTAYEYGRLWLHLAWMYSDVEDDEMFNFAYEKAREFYAKGWFTERVQLTPEGEQKLAVLISEMHVHAGMLDDAMKFVFEAIQMKNGSKAMTEKARDRLAEIKEMIIKERRESAESDGDHEDS